MSGDNRGNDISTHNNCNDDTRLRDFKFTKVTLPHQARKH